jgi:hypothetical protein
VRSVGQGRYGCCKAAKHGTPVEAGARGFGFNPSSKMLGSFLEIGTRVELRD